MNDLAQRVNWLNRVSRWKELIYEIFNVELFHSPAIVDPK